MTRVVSSAMMFATVSGCAQTAVVRHERSATKAAKTSGRRARKQSKSRSKRTSEAGKRS